MLHNYAGKHQYLTPPSLALHTAQLATRFIPDDAVLIDPCSGTGAIFDHLRSPKVARDIDPGFCDTPLDFLKASRTDFVSAGEKAAAICMNPPFRIQNQQKSAVVQFLNHAATCILRTGEWIVCIAPQQIRKPIKKKCDRIHDTLHLEHESVFEAMQPFHDVKNNKTKHVRVVVQVWRVIEDHIERPVFQQIQVPDFRLSYDPTPMPHFFIRIWTTMNQIGAVVACDESYSLQRDTHSKYNKTSVWLRGKKSNKIMVPGEYAICIAPITFSNYNVLGRVTETLHLVEENYIRENVYFFQPDTKKKKQVHLVVQVWQKRTQPSLTHGLHTKLRLTKEEEAKLPFRMTGNHKDADGTPSFYILRKGTGKDVGMTLTSTEIVGKVCRKGRKTIDRPFCSVFTMKRVTFDTKQMTSILAIHVAPEKRNAVFWTFHALYTMGVYTRYLGHGMYQGVQTINTSALKYMALYPDKIPTRESLNITTNFVGKDSKIQLDKENILRQQRLAMMYQTIPSTSSSPSR
jgi:hypothetical protein